jgi:hypothetical protein
MLPSVYPVRTAEDVILQMKENFKVFTELDLKIAFWQIEIEARDGEICAAVTDKDIYLPQRLVQGAKDSNSVNDFSIAQLRSVCGAALRLVVHSQNPKIPQTQRYEKLDFRNARKSEQTEFTSASAIIR